MRIANGALPALKASIRGCSCMARKRRADPNYAIGHQKLIKAAHDHNLIEADHEEPSLV